MYRQLGHGCGLPTADDEDDGGEVARLQPHRAESFKISPDPQLVEKIRDVVGLYVAPLANAVVFSVDEKSQIQALQRAQPILPMDFGQPERRTHNYVRHGTLARC